MIGTIVFGTVVQTVYQHVGKGVARLALIPELVALAEGRMHRLIYHSVPADALSPSAHIGALVPSGKAGVKSRARGGVYPRLDRLAEALTYVYPEFEFS